MSKLKKDEGDAGKGLVPLDLTRWTPVAPTHAGRKLHFAKTVGPNSAGRSELFTRPDPQVVGRSIISSESFMIC